MVESPYPKQPEIQDKFELYLASVETFKKASQEDKLKVDSIYQLTESLTSYLDAKPISSYNGKINSLGIFYPNNTYGEYSFDKILDSLITNFPSAKFYILHGFSDFYIGKDYEPYKRFKGIKTREGQSGKFYDFESIDHNPWIRDPFISFDYKNKKYLIEPYSFSDNGDDFANEFARNLPTEFASYRSNFHFQGGNILFGDDFVMVGWDDFDLNEKAYKKQRPLKNFESHFRKIFKIPSTFKIIKIGHPDSLKLNKSKWQYEGIERRYFGHINGSYQPLFHLDLFITLLGKKEKDGPFYLMLGEFKNASGIPWDELEDNEKDFINAMNSLLKKIFWYLYTIRDKNGNRKFKILRCPIAFVAFEADSARQWRPYCFNNALVENVNHSITIYLPSFDPAKADLKGQKYFQTDLKKIEMAFHKKLAKKYKIKYSVIGDFALWMMKGGALHCITHEFNRI